MCGGASMALVVNFGIWFLYANLTWPSSSGCSKTSEKSPTSTSTSHMEAAKIYLWRVWWWYCSHKQEYTRYPPSPLTIPPRSRPTIIPVCTLTLSTLLGAVLSDNEEYSLFHFDLGFIPAFHCCPHSHLTQSSIMSCGTGSYRIKDLSTLSLPSIAVPILTSLSHPSCPAGQGLTG
jgi:hypothetical protein